MYFNTKSYCVRFLSYALLCGAVACSEETDPAGAAGKGEKQTFEVEMDSGGMASDYPTTPPGGTVTMENIPSFNVSAFRSDNSNVRLMENVTVKRTGPNSWTYSPEVEWPDYPLDFEAVTPVTQKISGFGLWEWGSPSWINFNMDSWGYDAKTDLCIAVVRNIVKTDNRVRLNFRHAMARVEISGSAEMAGKKIFVKRVELYHVVRSSQFFFPKGSTFPHNELGQIDYSWTNWTQEQDYVTVPFFISASEDGDELPALPLNLGNQKNYFYIPFLFKDLTENNGYVSGSAIRLTCRISDEATGKKEWPDESTDYQLLPEAGKYDWGYIYFALKSDADGDRRLGWQPGRNYRYSVKVRNRGELPPPFQTGSTRGGDSDNELSLEETSY